MLTADFISTRHLRKEHPWLNSDWQSFLHCSEGGFHPASSQHRPPFFFSHPYPICPHICSVGSPFQWYSQPNHFSLSSLVLSESFSCLTWVITLASYLISICTLATLPEVHFQHSQVRSCPPSEQNPPLFLTSFREKPTPWGWPGRPYLVFIPHQSPTPSLQTSSLLLFPEQTSLLLHSSLIHVWFYILCYKYQHKKTVPLDILDGVVVSCSSLFSALYSFNPMW